MEKQQCCQPPKINTLKDELHRLIGRYTLPEVFDRLTDLAYEQQTLDRHSDISPQWNDLVQHLEKTTKAALVLVNSKEDLWV